MRGAGGGHGLLTNGILILTNNPTAPGSCRCCDGQHHAGGTPGDRSLSLAQAAKLSNLSLSLWKRWDVERRLPTFRPARNVVRIPAQFVSQIASGHLVPPPGAYPRPPDPRGKALTVP